MNSDRVKIFLTKERIACASIPFGSPQLPLIHRAQFSPAILELVVPDCTEIVVAAIWTLVGFIMLDVTCKDGLWSSGNPQLPGRTNERLRQGKASQGILRY